MSDYLSFRVGKQITPIGYWNLQPINVLRETTSSPRLSREMFPKFITGLDVHGFLPVDDTVTYHLFIQKTGDMDAKYINIPVDQHYGLTLDKALSSEWNIGGTVGTFEQLNKDTTRYWQLNSKLERGRFTFLAEAVLNAHERQLAPDDRSSSVYTQLEYQFKPKHTFIVRAESFRDDSVSLHEKIGIVGYSYRPLFPVSFKLEYQWHAGSRNSGLAGSFSVLF